MSPQRLSLLSAPGVYEVYTGGGPTYELKVPESVEEHGRIVLDRYPGTPDDDAAAQHFAVISAVFEVGQKGELVLELEKGEQKRVVTSEVTSIVRVV